LSKAFKIWYGINVETREHALRGWNWGKAEFTKAELAFNVQNRPAFEVPYSEISNTNLAGKNEVAVEFALSATENGANGQPAGSTKNRGRKAAAGPDELVEMRFYIPGTAVKKEKTEGAEGAEGEEDNEEEMEEQNAANLFYETLMDKAEIGDVAGDTFATFLDVLHLTPRFVPSALCLESATHLLAEVVSISTCTNHPSVFAAKPTTTRSNTPPSKSSSCFLRMTIPTHSLSWVWTPRCARARPATRS
jgi:hypothetical protein